MKKLLLCILILAMAAPASFAQRKKRKAKQEDTYKAPSESLYQAMEWRNIGPFRGGRSTAVCGVPGNTDLYYMGTTGGGVWKTENGGASWENISDGFFKTGSVGAVAVAPSDHNVIYVGMGEAPVRGVMTSHGDGVYKSTDAGQTWTHMGLDKVRQISKVRIHPNDHNIVYVSAQGSPTMPTAERGIYRSMDGGENWELVLHVDERSGASDLSMDASNPRILYAAFWEHQRLPWKVVSGGPGSSIWKSTDGGSNWTKLTEGLPKKVMGKIGVTVSPANPQRVWAIIEAEDGGLYRSDNGGKEWRLVNPDRVLRARSWYYMHVFADSQDPNTVYVLNAPVMKSSDGGRTFQRVGTPHGDNHDLWMHPDNNQIMINANDGGGNISYNGGKTWSTQRNQPTAQFYRVNADNQFPYRVYGGQQDNSSVSIVSRTQGRGIGWGDFHSVGGCESAYCAFDPDNPKLVYAGCYQGIISEYNVDLRMAQDVMAYPFLGLGTKPADHKYRFNWNAPILVSQHDPSVIYHAGNQLLRSTDRGNSWTEASPDLTRNIEENLDYGGGPITREGAGGEVYHTIMYIAEDPTDARTIWAGSDDGLIHITRDGGDNWTEITPPNAEEGMINCIEVSTHDPATAYVAYTRYKFNDFTPHVWVTRDYGQTWSDMAKGLPADAHVRVVRSDPAQKGLLYAGTELGLFISFDDAGHWNKFQLNLPIVPITDLKVHQGDLIAATQGRAFWILDNLGPLHQINDEMVKSDLFMYQPRNTYLFGGPKVENMTDMGQNPDRGIVINYYLNEIPENDSLDLKLEFMDASGKVLRTFASNEKSPAKKMDKKEGMNKLVWGLNMSSYEAPKDLTVLGGNGSYVVGPGKYTAKLSYGDKSLERNFEVLPDPRMQVSASAYAAKYQMLDQLDGAIKSLYDAVKDMRHVKGQISGLQGRFKDDESHKELMDQGKSIIEEINELEKALVQTKTKTFQDVINFENRLNAELGHIMNTIDNAVPPLTAGQQTRAKDVLGRWQEIEGKVQSLLGEKVDAYNQKVKEMDVPFVGKDRGEKAGS